MYLVHVSGIIWHAFSWVKSPVLLCQAWESNMSWAGSSNNSNFFSHSSWIWKPKIKALPGLDSPKGLCLVYRWPAFHYGPWWWSYAYMFICWYSLFKDTGYWIKANLYDFILSYNFLKGYVFSYGYSEGLAIRNSWNLGD